MNLSIKPLAPELAGDYFDFFENRAFTDDSPYRCYCQVYQMSKQGNRTKSHKKGRCNKEHRKGRLAHTHSHEASIQLRITRKLNAISIQIAEYDTNKALKSVT